MPDEPTKKPARREAPAPAEPAAPAGAAPAPAPGNAPPAPRPLGREEREDLRRKLKEKYH
jgi:hypothetical protein